MRRTTDIAPSYALEAGHPEDVLARCVQILTNDGHLATSLPDVGSALWRHDNREEGPMTNEAGNAAQWHFPGLRHLFSSTAISVRRLPRVPRQPLLSQLPLRARTCGRQRPAQWRRLRRRTRLPQLHPA